MRDGAHGVGVDQLRGLRHGHAVAAADEGIALDEGMSRVAPDVILLDARLRDYFASPEAAADGGRFSRWLRQHDARVLGRIDDPTYGVMEVYGVQSPR